MSDEGTFQLNEIDNTERSKLMDETIGVFVDLAFMDKYADTPTWMDFDLTVSQVRSIYLLTYHQILSISQLARLLGMGNPAASILVQQLVEQGLVERTEDLSDRRRTLVSLTNQGRLLVNGRRDLREAQFRRRLSRMSNEDLLGLLRGVKAMVAIIRSEQG